MTSLRPFCRAIATDIPFPRIRLAVVSSPIRPVLVLWLEASSPRSPEELSCPGMTQWPVGDRCDVFIHKETMDPFAEYEFIATPYASLADSLRQPNAKVCPT
jgi:hypothetical protein